MIYVTPGDRYTDIDGLASTLAYRDLLILEGNQSLALLPGLLNQSITPTINSWDFKFETQISGDNYKFVVVDDSNPDMILDMIDQDKIVEIYDHHPGYIDFWQEKIGDKAKIESIGACATLIWEEYKKRGFADKISTLNANLLYTAILSNTLNFHAAITTERDKTAFNEIKKFTDLPEDWVKRYYQEIDSSVLSDPQKPLKGDTKVITIHKTGKTYTLGQLELWNSSDFIVKNKILIKEALSSFNNPDWVFIAPSIDEGIDYIFTESLELKSFFEKYIDTQFEGDVGKTKKLWLRKEILKQLLEV